jgi:Ca2+-binding EF-hand superfamily protein
MFSTPPPPASIDKAKLIKLWNTFDYNRNHLLSLAEIDRACLELFPLLQKVITSFFYLLFQKKPVLLRAYKAADISCEGFVTFDEFENLVKLLGEYDKVYTVFKKIDVNNDDRIDFKEFKKGYNLTGLKPVGEAQLKTIFDKMDSNRGGFVLFDEFSIYAAKQRAGIGKVDHTTSLMTNNQVTYSPAKTAQYLSSFSSSSTHGTKSGSSHPIVGERLRDIPERDFDKMWNVFDYNGNGICSLAEIDRAVLMVLPSISKHKPAIMRAYKTADLDQNGYISRTEFRHMTKLLSYYNDLFLLFQKMDSDNDRRVGFEEFKKGAKKISLIISEGKLSEEFDRMDRNGGGVVFNFLIYLFAYLLICSFIYLLCI